MKHLSHSSLFVWVTGLGLAYVGWVVLVSWSSESLSPRFLEGMWEVTLDETDGVRTFYCFSADGKLTVRRYVRCDYQPDADWGKVRWRFDDDKVRLQDQSGADSEVTLHRNGRQLLMKDEGSSAEEGVELSRIDSTTAAAIGKKHHLDWITLQICMHSRLGRPDTIAPYLQKAKDLGEPRIVDRRGPNGATPLIEACMANELETVSYLLYECDASVEVTHGLTDLMPIEIVRRMKFGGPSYGLSHLTVGESIERWNFGDGPLLWTELHIIAALLVKAENPAEFSRRIEYGVLREILYQKTQQAREFEDSAYSARYHLDRVQTNEIDWEDDEFAVVENDALQPGFPPALQHQLDPWTASSARELSQRARGIDWSRLHYGAYQPPSFRLSSQERQRHWTRTWRNEIENYNEAVSETLRFAESFYGKQSAEYLNVLFKLPLIDLPEDN